MTSEVVSQSLVKGVERTLRSLMAEGSGLPPAQVIPANEEGREPDGEYACLKLVNLKHVARRVVTQLPHAGAPDGSYRYLLSLPTMTHWMAKWVRGEATQNALEFVLWTQTDEAIEWLLGSGLAIMDMPSMGELNLAVDQDWRAMANVDLMVGFTAQALVQDGRLRQVSLSTSIDDINSIIEVIDNVS